MHRNGWIHAWRREPEVTTPVAVRAAAGAGAVTYKHKLDAAQPVSLSLTAPANLAEYLQIEDLKREAAKDPLLQVIMLTDAVTVPCETGGTRVAVVGEQLSLCRSLAQNLVARGRCELVDDTRRTERQRRLVARRREVVEAARAAVAKPTPPPPPPVLPPVLPAEAEACVKIRALKPHIGFDRKVVGVGESYQCPVEFGAERVRARQAEFIDADEGAPA